MPETNQLKDQTGALVPGYLNASSGSGKPAVIIVHEWWGLNEHIRNIADRVAHEGFISFAVDLYDGRSTKDAKEAEQLMTGGNVQHRLFVLQSAIDAISRTFPKSSIGIMGFCMGGAYALAAAARNPLVRACSPFYGIPTPEMGDVTRIKGRVLGHFAKDDPHVNTARVTALRETLKLAGVKAELFEYDAKHAFFNDTRKEVYSPANAKLAWERTVAFFKETLYKSL